MKSDEEIKDGGPAFPMPIAGCNDGAVYPACQVIDGGGGMSLRDWFAGMALQNIAASILPADILGDDPSSGHTAAAALKNITEACYNIADAMIAAREERTK